MSAVRMLASTPFSGMNVNSSAPEEDGVYIIPVPLLNGEPQPKPKRTAKKQAFALRAMYKYELADWYGEPKHRFAATYCKPVMRALKRAGYTESIRLFSRTMVKIIVDFHGEPDSDSAK